MGGCKGTVSSSLSLNDMQTIHSQEVTGPHLPPHTTPFSIPPPLLFPPPPPPLPLPGSLFLQAPSRCMAPFSSSPPFSQQKARPNLSLHLSPPLLPTWSFFRASPPPDVYHTSCCTCFCLLLLALQLQGVGTWSSSQLLPGPVTGLVMLKKQRGWSR